MPMKREATSDSLLANGPRSEYVKRYQEYPLQRTKSIRPSNELIKGQGEVESVTVFRRDFPEHPLAKRERPVPREGNLRPEGQHDFTSSYQNEYPERSGERRMPYKPEAQREALATFDAQPSYRDDYREWDLPKKHQIEKESWRPPQQPFEGQTTIMTDYVEHQVSPRVDHKPNLRTVQSNVPFSDSTDYKDTYREHPLPAKTQREREKWVKPSVPLDSTTVHQRDYIGAYAPKQKSLRPDNGPQRSDIPLEGDTTHSLAYKPHEIPKRYKHEPEKYTRPDGFMDLNTTNSTQFKEHPLQRQSQVKPESSHLLRGSGEMTKETNYGKDFQEHPINRTEPIKPKNDYQAPTVPMESLTEYQADFYGRQPGPRENFKPKDGPMLSDVPFNDRTDYRDTFVEHKITQRQQKAKEEYKGPIAPLDSRTTARDSYLGLYQSKRESFKPTQTLVKSDAPFDDSTTNYRDFQPHEVHRREMYRPSQYEKPIGEIDLRTSHNTHYVEHALEKQKKIEKPGSSHLIGGTGEMNTKTNYQGDFFERPIDKRKSMKPENEYQPPAFPMLSETTHRADFFERPLGPRESYKPREEPMNSDIPLDDRTGYRDDYVQHKITPREKRAREIHQAPTMPLDDRTTVMDSYRGAVQPKRESFRPDGNLQLPDGPFDGKTITNSDYREHKLPDRYRHKADSYIKPDGQMDLNTTHSIHFQEHALSKNTINRPGSSGLLKGFGDMKKESNYQKDYREHQASKRDPIKPKNDYLPSSAPMESTTTNQSTYFDLGLVPRVNFKPINDYVIPNIPLDDRTDYRDTFTEHQISPRLQRAKEEYKPTTAPLDSRTITNTSYVGAYQPKRESFRPDQTYVKPNTAIENNTTTGSAYKQWPTSERFKHKQEPYVRPEGAMEMTTTNREAYKEVIGHREPMVRLSSSHLLPSGKFDDNTIYNTAFVSKNVEQTQSMKPDNRYHPSSLPFEDKTEYRAAHVGYFAPKEKSLKPDHMSDALGQRDPSNPFHIKDDWRERLTRPRETTVHG
ncbi:uncharacterized protein LOC106051746 [Biomphalaria glabrata]|uniref:Uncharacterized protein LOC106051746 n=1 Tax=Biomphalaria glabrata TaxID=6526 RepID=A0A9W2ZVF0_BIOGL|nr:uncharacterized protein LOC106051746 [Biomphalaria glabrata]